MMLPWEHAALGYIVYSAYCRWNIGRPPIGLTVFALGFGTQIPDLVDKPLWWVITLLSYGRSLTHSLITFVIIIVILWTRAQYQDQRSIVIAFGIGYLTHLIGDSIQPILRQEYTALGYLLWPVTVVPKSETLYFIEFFLAVEPTPIVLVGSGFTFGGILLWIYDGLPGFRDLYHEYQQ